MDEIPHHEGLFREVLVVEEAFGVGRQVEFRELGCRSHHPTKARRLAIGKDRTPGERGDSAHSDGLGKEHRGVRGVAGSEIEKPDGHEELVRVCPRLQFGNEVRPDHLDEQGLDEPVRAAVLGVHGEHHEVTQTIDPVVLGLERGERIEKVRHAEVVPGPALEVGCRCHQILGVVREHRLETQEITRDLTDDFPGIGVIDVVRDAAVLSLQRAQPGDRFLEAEPVGMTDQICFGTVAVVLSSTMLDDLGFPNNRFACGAREL